MLALVADVRDPRRNGNDNANAKLWRLPQKAWWWRTTTAAIGRWWWWFPASPASQQQQRDDTPATVTVFVDSILNIVCYGILNKSGTCLHKQNASPP
mmetsp:Transcript_21590/g.47171  ORF Transcript_21590/g.47171 Transcript_21590/m.47171 type:complete len:97 (-) Transcript_21590:264-554(-)